MPTRRTLLISVASTIITALLSPRACGRFSWAENDISPSDFTMDKRLKERLVDLGLPLVLNLPLDHGRPNQGLPLGAQAQLDGNNALLSLMA